MNTEPMFSSKTDMWETPQDLFDRLDAIYRFDLDVCAVPENAKCERYFTPEIDGLKQDWSGTCWMNPPYGREIGKWVRKAYESVLGVGGYDGMPPSVTNRYGMVPRLRFALCGH